MHPRPAGTSPLSLTLGFKVGDRVSLVDPQGFFTALGTCSFLVTYSVSFVRTQGHGVRCPRGPLWEHIPFQADRSLPLLG